MANIPPVPPPQVDTEGRFARWTYQFWDYVAKNRAGFANAQITGTSPISVGTSGTSSFAISHGISGVVPGTYGNSTSIFQGVVNTYGHVTAGTTLPIAFPSPRALEGSAPIAVATGAGTYTVSHNTSGVAAGTFGAAMVTSQLVVDARGHVTSGTNIGTLGTFAGFNSLVAAGLVTGTTTTGTLTTAQTRVVTGYVTGTTTTGTMTAGYAGTLVGAGDVLGTSTTGTFTGALSTTGVTAGTYNSVVVDVKGRVTLGGTSTTGVPWQANQHSVATGGTVSVGTGSEMFFNAAFTADGQLTVHGRFSIL